MYFPSLIFCRFIQFTFSCISYLPFLHLLARSKNFSSLFSAVNIIQWLSVISMGSAHHTRDICSHAEWAELRKEKWKCDQSLSKLLKKTSLWKTPLQNNNYTKHFVTPFVSESSFLELSLLTRNVFILRSISHFQNLRYFHDIAYILAELL